MRKKPHHDGRHITLDLIATQAAQLEKIAVQADLRFLGYLLSMVKDEAKQTRDREAYEKLDALEQD